MIFKPLYALKCKSGLLVPETLARTVSECWGLSFDHVAFAEGEKWRERYWKRWRPAMLSAKRLGYSIVRVKLVED
jgi:hypothetical protein